jgi:hypothetical protein
VVVAAVAAVADLLTLKAYLKAVAVAAAVEPV